jgi:predicted porin
MEPQMKPTPLILLALAAGAPLFAQIPQLTVSSGNSSVTVFGILDAGIANVDHTLSFGDQFVVGTNPIALLKSSQTAAGSATGVMNGGISQTRWGIKGQLDLGEGLKGVFDLETAFSLGNGTLATSALAMNTSNAQVSADTSLEGQLFGRTAYVGLSSDTCGTLTIGRHTSLMLDLIPAYDALQGAQFFTPIGFSGSYGGGGATDNSRVDNSLKYRVKVGEVSLGALYKFSGVAGDATARGVSEVSAQWEHEGFGVMFAYEFAKDTTGIGNPSGVIVNSAVTSAVGVTPVVYSKGQYEPIGTITVTAENTHSTMLAAHYKVGDWFFAAGYEKEQMTNASDPAVMAGLTSLVGLPIATTTNNAGVTAPAVTVTPFTPTGGVPGEKDLTVTWLGGNYSFTKKLNLGISYYHVSQGDWSQGIAHLEADMSGTTTYTSLLLDYHISKPLDLYLGYMKTNVSGSMAIQANSSATAAAEQFPYTSNAATGFGIRYMF